MRSFADLVEPLLEEYILQIDDKELRYDLMINNIFIVWKNVIGHFGENSFLRNWWGTVLENFICIGFQ